MDAVPADIDPTSGVRRIPVAAFLALVVAYLAIIKVGGLLVESQVDDPEGPLRDADQVFWGFFVPIGASLVFVGAAVLVLGWWRPVLVDHKPVQAWVRIVPIIFALSILVGINYAGLTDNGWAFVLSLLVATQFVGWAEEGMFRGIGVTTFRVNGFSESRVALWSSVVFGAAHIVNLLGGDPRAFGQAVAVSFAGYFFYLIRRWSGSNVLNSVLHGLFDFTILSGTAIVPEGESGYVGAVAPLLTYLVVGVIVFARRHRIEPAADVTSAGPGAPA